MTPEQLIETLAKALRELKDAALFPADYKDGQQALRIADRALAAHAKYAKADRNKTTVPYAVWLEAQQQIARLARGNELLQVEIQALDANEQDTAAAFRDIFKMRVEVSPEWREERIRKAANHAAETLARSLATNGNNIRMFYRDWLLEQAKRIGEEQAWQQGSLLPKGDQQPCETKHAIDCLVYDMYEDYPCSCGLEEANTIMDKEPSK